MAASARAVKNRPLRLAIPLDNVDDGSCAVRNITYALYSMSARVSPSPEHSWSNECENR
jgi:hypothetical protein